MSAILLGILFFFAPAQDRHCGGYERVIDQLKEEYPGVVTGGDCQWSLLAVIVDQDWNRVSCQGRRGLYANWRDRWRRHTKIRNVNIIIVLVEYGQTQKVGEFTFGGGFKIRGCEGRCDDPTH